MIFSRTVLLGYAVFFHDFGLQGEHVFMPVRTTLPVTLISQPSCLVFSAKKVVSETERGVFQLERRRAEDGRFAVAAALSV